MRTPTYNLSHLWKHTLLFTLLVSSVLGTALSASAASLSFSVNGTNSATGTSLVGWANFTYDATKGTLQVQVINGSGIALNATDVLSGIYWQRSNTSAALAHTTATVTGSSIIWNKSSTQSIGSMWQFETGINGGNSTNEAIDTVTGITGGIVNGISNTKTSADVLKTTLIQNEMTFNLTAAKGFSLNDIQNVYFQFGGTLSGPRLLAKLAVPEPGTVAMLASMGASSLLVGVRRYRRRRRA